MEILLISRIVLWIGITILLYALVFDRIRQVWRKCRRCPKCWYDMSHTLGLTCSECGFAAKRERKLFRGKRCWKLVFVSLLLFAGSYSIRVTPDVKDRGWPAAVPTTVLIVSLPWLRPEIDHVRPDPKKYFERQRLLPADVRKLLSGSIATRLFNDTCFRLQTEQLENWQVKLCEYLCDRQMQEHNPDMWLWQSLHHRVLASTTWSPGDQLAVWPNVDPTCNLKLVVETRDVWPQNTEIFIRSELEETGCNGIVQLVANPLDCSSLDTIEKHHVALGTTCCGIRSAMEPAIWSDGLTRIGFIDHALGDIFYEVMTTQWTYIRLPSPRQFFHIRVDAVLDRSQMKMPCRVEGTLNEILKPVVAPEFDEHLLERVRHGTVWSTGYGRYRLIWETGDRPVLLRALNGATFAFCAEVVDGDKVVANGKAWFTSTSDYRFEDVSIVLKRNDGLDDLEPQDTDGPLRLRLRSDPETALRNFQAKSYWKGILELPLEIVDENPLYPAHIKELTARIKEIQSQVAENE